MTEREQVEGALEQFLFGTVPVDPDGRARLLAEVQRTISNAVGLPHVLVDDGLVDVGPEVNTPETMARGELRARLHRSGEVLDVTFQKGAWTL